MVWSTATAGVSPVPRSPPPWLPPPALFPSTPHLHTYLHASMRRYPPSAGPHYPPPVYPAQESGFPTQESRTWATYQQVCPLFLRLFPHRHIHTHTHTHTPALDPEDPARTHLHPHTHRPTRASPSTPRRNIQARTRTHTLTTGPPLRHTPPPTPRSMGTRKITRKIRTVTRRTRLRPRAIRRPRGTMLPRSPSRTRPRSSRGCRGIRRKLIRPLRRERRGRQGREEGPCGRYSIRMVGWPGGLRRPVGWGARRVDKCLGRCRVLLLGGAARWGARSRQRPNWQWLGTTP